jgi:hypothetical protein
MLRQMLAPCWVLVGPDETGYCPLGLHYPGQAAAARAATSIRRCGGDVEPAPLLTPCWYAVCGHGVVLLDTVPIPLHAASPAGFTEPGSSALRRLAASGWSISPGGIVRCAPLAAGDPPPGPGAIDLTSFEFPIT